MFKLLEDLKLSDRLHWTDTKMGYYYQGKLHKWGTPFALLGFPHLGLLDKVRYALHVMHTKGISDWTALDKENARDWITRWIGPKAYKVMWEKAFTLKFFEYQNALSASWIGTRIKRVALSRRNLFNESMGYLEGGSAVLLERMAAEVTRLGGRILLSQPIQEVSSLDGKVTGILTRDGHHAYDGVVSTAPIQYVPSMVPSLPKAFADKVGAIDNIPVACVILKLSKPVSENFWMNISDDRISIPGLIEYSNLNPGKGSGEHIVYAPYYMPKTHPKWQWSNQQLIDEVISYLPMINPDFKPEWIRATHCHRYEYAQTICPPGFQDLLPPMKTPLQGFYMADTAYYYPEDRSINESIAVGQHLAAEALSG
ncbi:conserved hypothetical protein [Xanthomonas citri pv. aurantifolii str. ICPB 11122]|nr:conserved hypothetical protein [Xanthomonas citri pv. aurantifolii str. ICPB 11122]